MRDETWTILAFFLTVRRPTQDVHSPQQGDISVASLQQARISHHPQPITWSQVLYLVSSTAECYLSRKYGLRVGAPYGGVCLPKDVPELTSLAPEGSVFREFLSGTGKINEWITNTPSLKVSFGNPSLFFLPLFFSLATCAEISRRYSGGPMLLQVMP